MSKTLLYTLVVIFAIAVALVAWVIFRKSDRGAVVLGQRLADAYAVEQERLARNPGPSPLAGKDYEQDAHGHSLYFVEESQLDETIRKLVAEFAGSSPDARDQLMSRLSMDDLYTLLHFSKRSAVFALREHKPERCAEAAMALAAIDEERIDPRDLHWAAGVVDAAATAIGADRTKLYREAAARASPPVRTVLLSLYTQNTAGASFEDWGYRIVNSPSGPSLANAEFNPYAPDSDLIDLATRVAEVMVSERYPSVEFTVATAIPTVWIGSGEKRVEDVLRSSTGTVLLRLSAANRQQSSQLFNVYFSELETEEAAAWLARVAPNEKPGQKATVAFSAGRIICVGIGASTVIGVKSVESSASLTKALEPARRILSEWVTN